MEVIPNMYIFGNDYIKYLNDDKKRLLTYDQWKQSSDKRISAKRVKTTRYTEGYYSPSDINKNK